MQAADKWGITLITGKTKGLVIGQCVEDSDVGKVLLEAGLIEVVEGFTYLGSIIARDEEIQSEVSSFTAKAARAFRHLSRHIFRNTSLSIANWNTVYYAAVLLVNTSRTIYTELRCGPSRQST